MLSYYLISIICDYLDKTEDRYNLHMCCKYYYNNYQFICCYTKSRLDKLEKIGYQKCQKCGLFLDRWDKSCDICFHYYHQACIPFILIKGKDVCKNCSQYVCQLCLNRDLRRLTCIHCLKKVGFSCCVQCWGYDNGNEEFKAVCTCVDCINNVVCYCDHCGNENLDLPKSFHFNSDDRLFKCKKCGDDDIITENWGRFNEFGDGDRVFLDGTWTNYEIWEFIVEWDNRIQRRQWGIGR